MAHILIDKAHRFSSPTLTPLTGWKYRRDIGAWVDEDRPENLLVAEPPTRDAQAHPRPGQPRPTPKPRPMTKKADIETGEDQK